MQKAQMKNSYGTSFLQIVCSLSSLNDTRAPPLTDKFLHYRRYAYCKLVGDLGECTN